MKDFKEEFSFEKRKAEAMRITKKYPDRVPIIVEKAKNNSIADIDKRKYLCPSDLTIGQFLYVLRKRIRIPPEKAIFLFVDGFLPPTSMLVSDMYKKYKSDDLFLYCVYSGESCFGVYL